MKKIFIILICTGITLVGAKCIMEIYVLRMFEPNLGVSYNSHRKVMGIPLMDASPVVQGSPDAPVFLWKADSSPSPSHYGKFITKEDPYINSEQDDYHYGPDKNYTYTQTVKYNWVTGKVTQCSCQGTKYTTVDSCKNRLQALIEHGTL